PGGPGRFAVMRLGLVEPAPRLEDMTETVQRARDGGAVAGGLRGREAGDVAVERGFTIAFGVVGAADAPEQLRRRGHGIVPVESERGFVMLARHGVAADALRL